MVEDDAFRLHVDIKVHLQHHGLHLGFVVNPASFARGCTGRLQESAHDGSRFDRTAPLGNERTRGGQGWGTGTATGGHRARLPRTSRPHQRMQEAPKEARRSPQPFWPQGWFKLRASESNIHLRSFIARVLGGLD